MSSMHSRRKINIPLSIEKVDSGSYNYFLNEKKVLLFLVSLFGCAAFIFLTVRLATSMGSQFMALGLYSSITISAIYLFYFIRWVIFEERRQRRLMAALINSRESYYSAFWGIDNIQENGIISYKVSKMIMKRALIVKTTRGSVVGRPANFPEQHQEALAKFYRALYSEGFSIRKYSVAENKLEPDNLRYILDQTNNYKGVEGTPAKKIAVAYANHLLHLTRLHKSIESEYYIIYCSSFFKMRKFYQIVENIIRQNLGSNFFKDKRILNAAEVKAFTAYILQINGFPEVAPDEDDIPDFSEYGEVTKAYNMDGSEKLIIYRDEDEEDDEEYEDEDESLDSPKYPGNIDVEIPAQERKVYRGQKNNTVKYDVKVLTRGEGEEVLDDEEEVSLTDLLKPKEEPKQSEEEEVDLLAILNKK